MKPPRRTDRTHCPKCGRRIGFKVGTWRLADHPGAYPHRVCPMSGAAIKQPVMAKPYGGGKTKKKKDKNQDAFHAKTVSVRVVSGGAPGSSRRK